jgi:hypothetical protein
MSPERDACISGTLTLGSEREGIFVDSQAANGEGSGRVFCARGGCRSWLNIAIALTEFCAFGRCLLFQRPDHDTPAICESCQLLQDRQ